MKRETFAVAEVYVPVKRRASLDPAPTYRSTLSRLAWGRLAPSPERLKPYGSVAVHQRDEWFPENGSTT
jgi:hypothetical protein